MSAADDLLKRSLAPILAEAWDAIDDEARRVLKLHLAGRKLVDFQGPFGWTHAAVNTGRLDPFDVEPAPGVHAGLRRVQPLVEMRTPILLPILELDALARGATDTDLDPVRGAAQLIARAEDGAIFNGFAAGGIVGIVKASPHAPLEVASAAEWPRAAIEAKEVLRRAGIDGPYALALGTAAYDTLFATAEDGYPIVKRIERHIVDGPIVRASAVQGGVLLSVRGGDYALTVGQDLSIGYADRSRTHVELFLAESFTFRVLEPKAAVHLKAS